jgi:hypothetical protein
MASIEHYDGEDRTPATPAPGTERGPAAADPMRYTDVTSPEPTWARQRAEVIEAARSASGAAIDAAWASLALPPVVRRSRATGRHFAHRSMWCVGPTGVTLIDARQDGQLDPVTRRLHPKGPWRADVDHRPAGDGSVTVKRGQAPAVAVPTGSAAAAVGNDPHSVGYGGRYPNIWTNLPLTLRELIEFAVPISQADAEYATSRLLRDTTTTERFWYERRNTGVVTGVYAWRGRTGRVPRSTEAGVRFVQREPWSFVTFRAALTRTAPVSVARGQDTSSPT